MDTLAFSAGSLIDASSRDHQPALPRCDERALPLAAATESFPIDLYPLFRQTLSLLKSPLQPPSDPESFWGDHRTLWRPKGESIGAGHHLQYGPLLLLHELPW